jgi:hypothetical protein
MSASYQHGRLTSHIDDVGARAWQPVALVILLPPLVPIAAAAAAVATT